jgi:hypothetical protein
MTPSSPQGARTFCGFCGFADAQPFLYCPRCGHAATASDERTRASGGLSATQPNIAGFSETFGDQPTQAGTQPYGPPQSGALPPAGQRPSGAFYPAMGQPAGWAAQGSGSITTGAPAQAGRRHRKRWVAITSVLLVLVLLGAGTVFAYTAFFAFSQTATAQYLPGSTIFYASFDLQQIAQNPHGISQTDATGLGAEGLACSTGLDFQKDIQPWIGQGFTYALVSITKQANAAGIGQNYTSGTVCLISTRDTGKSNAALQKAMQLQQQKYGVTFSSITYNGTTLHSDADAAQGSAAPPLVLGTFKDQVLVASSLAVADQVIDRYKSNNDTLANNATFSKAMGKLPGNRFGTLYVNTSELANTLLSFGDNTGQAASLFPYPDGYGALQFTDEGMRLTFTLESKAGTTVKYPVNGNTNASASVVPASAILYGGLGNLSAFYDQAKDSSSGLLTDALFQQAVGLAPDDPLFNAPLSFAVLATPNTSGDADNVVDGLVMLHASGDPASADAKVQQALVNINAHTSTSTISGVTVTTIQALQDNNTIDLTSGAGGSYKTVAYYAPLGHDLVFASSTNAITQAIATYQGKQASLAKSALFTQMVKQQPQDTAFSLFISLDNLANAPGALGQDYKQLTSDKNSLISKTRASYLTYTWTNQGITITEDIALQ